MFDYELLMCLIFSFNPFKAKIKTVLSNYFEFYLTLIKLIVRTWYLNLKTNTFSITRIVYTIQTYSNSNDIRKDISQLFLLYRSYTSSID